MNKSSGLFLLFLLFRLCAPCFGEDAVEDRTPIKSLLQRGDVIFVSSDAGIYRADVKEKVWHKMDVPAAMVPGGTFAKQDDPASPLLAYFHGLNDYPRLANAPALFISKDAGKTWAGAKLPEGRKFTEFYLLPNGWLYACGMTGQFPAVIMQSKQSMPMLVANPHPEFNMNGTEPMMQIFCSKDMGATWTNISMNLPGDYGFGRMFADPDHADQVCLLGSYMRHVSRSFLFQRDPATGLWAKNDTSTWHDGKLSIATAWRDGRDWGGGVRGQPEYDNRVTATPDNFFALPFLKSGYGLSIFVTQVETEKPAYTFRKDEPKIIPIKVVFLDPAHTPVHVLDFEDERVFWGLSMLPATKDSPRFDPLVTPLWNGEITPEMQKKMDAYMGDPALKIVMLDAQHPYERKIDLSQMYDFSKPGTYKFQLYHNDAALVLWGNSFGSQVIEVTITP